MQPKGLVFVLVVVVVVVSVVVKKFVNRITENGFA